MSKNSFEIFNDIRPLKFCNCLEGIWAVFSFLLLQTLYSGWSSTRGVIKHEKPTITADINQKNIQDIESEDVLLDHDYDGIKELDKIGRAHV